MRVFIRSWLVCGIVLLGSPSFAAASSVTSEETVPSKGGDLVHSWEGDEESVYLSLTLLKELRFSRYAYLRGADHQGVKIECHPREAAVFTSDEGYALEKILLTVIAENTDHPSQLAYTITRQDSYNGINQQGHQVSRIVHSVQEGMLRNPPIDLNQEVEFFLIDGEGLDEGVVLFRNSFPYSQIN